MGLSHRKSFLFKTNKSLPRNGSCGPFLSFVCVVVLHKERPLNVEVIECGLLQVFAITGIIEVMVNCANYCLAAIITIITDYSHFPIL